MNGRDTLHCYGYIHGEIGKARVQRDLAVAQLILDAADGMARFAGGLVTRVFRIRRGDGARTRA